MKILIQISVILTILCTYNLAQDESAAMIQFEHTKYDFQTITADSALTVVFKFINSGTDTLRILSVRPG